jgi:hypothetical protein
MICSVKGAQLEASIRKWGEHAPHRVIEKMSLLEKSFAGADNTNSFYEMAATIRHMASSLVVVTWHPPRGEFPLVTAV